MIECSLYLTYLHKDNPQKLKGSKDHRNSDKQADESGVVSLATIKVADAADLLVSEAAFIKNFPSGYLYLT